MKTLTILAALALLAVMAAALWVRSVRPDPERYHTHPDTPPAGDYPADGGFTAVRTVPDPTATLARIYAIAEDSPRTQPLAGSLDEGHVSVVTRSRVMGFPDVTNMWIDEGRVAVRGRLVLGRSDLGVNRARIRRWLDAAGLDARS